MYEAKTFEAIMEEMLSRVSDNMDKREGSIIYDALAPCAAELAQTYIELDWLVQQTFADTATGQMLERRCAERGIYRSQATKAVLKGVAEPAEIELSVGERFNLNDINYVVVSAYEDGYMVECETAGSIGNKYFGELTPINYVQGITSFSLTELLYPAEDAESDEELRARYFESFDSRAFAGNKADYLAKTNAITGVGSCKVTPVWNGGGTVKLTILDITSRRASDALIKAVQDNFDEKKDGTGSGLAPIGHVVTVDTVTELGISVATSITFDGGYDFSKLKSKIEEAIKEYLASLAKAWADETQLVVRISQIEAYILKVDGVLDVTGTKLNGVSSNITCTEYQVPVFTEVINEQNS